MRILLPYDAFLSHPENGAYGCAKGQTTSSLIYSSYEIHHHSLVYTYRNRPLQHILCIFR